MIRKFLIILILILVPVQIGLVFVVSDKQHKSLKAPVIDVKKSISEEKEIVKKDIDLPIHNAYFSNKEFYEEAYQSKSENNLVESDKVFGGIVPHHLIVKNNIARFFTELEDYKYKRVVLIGPNHFEAGNSDIILSRSKWNTPYGELMPDLNLIDSLEELSQVAIEEEPFYREHSISGLVAFIKKSFPDALFVPIILKNNYNQENLSALAEKIYSEVESEETLVLASVDFSHYLPAQVADFHDERSNSVIKNFELDRVESMEIDSAPSIFTLLNYLKLVEAKNANLRFHTNSGEMTQELDEPTTTHNFFYFTKGEEAQNSTVSMMFFGDMMLDRYIGEVIERKGLYYLFEKIKGEENRFFRGMDIIGANLEGAVINNGEHYNPIMVNDFAFSPNVVNELSSYNFNYFNLANNHFSDQGEKGMNETRENLDRLGFYYSGCKDRQIDKDCSTKIVEVGDKKIALLGFSMVYGSFDIIKAGEIVAQAKKDSDFVLVNIHWGQEYKHDFNGVQQNVAHKLIDAGADAIVGHHPHIVQGMEIYKEKAIFYSLGNFIFDQYKPYFPKDNGESIALGITFDNNSVKYHLFPIEFKDWQLDFIKGEARDKFFEEFVGWSSLEGEYEELDLNLKI